MTALIEIRDLSIIANGKQILKNINLDINEGDSIGIIGKSGAGKSTLLHLLHRKRAKRGRETESCACTPAC
ncbi:MAG: hypothetical protein C3F06_07395 [Candidatus Methanoperedenaceae archaeon]|nr:MAG: hypothetical protein C3F06_07395 [Candidatus Methanoperedenaceae archaeon]